MSTGAALRDCLAEHRWIAQAHGGTAGMLVLLNQAGYDALHQQGRAALLVQLQHHLAAQSLGVPSAWRLLDGALEAPDAQSIQQRLQAPRPTEVTPTAEHMHDGRWTLTLRLPPDLVQFDDHFRHAPVLPGVMQVGMVLALAAPRLGTSRHCRDMEALKFQRVLRPGNELQLRLWFEEQPGTGCGKLYFAYTMEGAHCSSGRLHVARP